MCINKNYSFNYLVANPDKLLTMALHAAAWARAQAVLKSDLQLLDGTAFTSTDPSSTTNDPKTEVPGVFPFVFVCYCIILLNHL